jgi:hypothetical protein
MLFISLTLCSFIHSQALIVQDGPLASLFVVSWSHTHTHTDTRWNSSGRVISPSQRPVPTQDNTTDKHPCPERDFEPATPATKRPQTYALDRSATGINLMLHVFIWIFRVDGARRLWNILKGGGSFKSLGTPELGYAVGTMFPLTSGISTIGRKKMIVVITEEYCVYQHLT